MVHLFHMHLSPCVPTKYSFLFSTTSIQLVDLLLKNYDQVLTREGPLSNAYHGAYIMPDWLPDILTITFNRTAVSASDQEIKVKTQVDFPILLGMENICHNAKNMAGELQYKLRFAVVHDGSSIHGGMFLFHEYYRMHTQLLNPKIS